MKHITQEQRYTIKCLLEQNYTVSKIGKVIGKDRSSIYREIARNKDQRTGIYEVDLAQRKYEKRLKEKPKLIKFTPSVKQDVLHFLAQGYSPEQIEGYCQKEGLACVSHERIYQYIWLDKKKGGSLYEHLRQKGRKYRKRGSKKDKRGIISRRTNISKRPAIVEQRLRFGDIEVDTIIGKNHKSVLVTINDRASGMLKMKKVASKEAKLVADIIIDELQDWLPYLKTITSDNGKEFAEHERIAEVLGIDFFFADPYHSWQRGSNENLNGLIRQYFPKKTDFSEVSEQEIKAVEKLINQRPRKRFQYKNPEQKMDWILFNQNVAFVT